MGADMLRVLFLEDEPDLAEYLPIVLANRGLEVIGTTSIDKTLELFEKEDFDAVLLDIMMSPTPDMDAEKLDYGRRTGIEVARRMKAAKPDVPIVAFTVVTDPKVRQEMRKAGIVVMIISKPDEPARIAQELLRIIGNHS